VQKRSQDNAVSSILLLYHTVTRFLDSVQRLILQQEKLRTCNVTMRCDRVTTVVVEKQ